MQHNRGSHPKNSEHTMGQLISSAILVVFVGSALMYGSHETVVAGDSKEMIECVDPSEAIDKTMWVESPSDTSGCAFLDLTGRTDRTILK